MDHVALDRAGTDNRHLDDQIVIAARLEARQHRHLRPAFDLKDADGVGTADHVIGGAVAIGQRGERFAAAIMGVEQREGLADAGQHAERQHIDLEHAEAFEIILVPLDDGAVLHRRVLDRDQRGELVTGDDETADMLRQMPRKTGDLGGQIEHLRQMLVGGIKACPAGVLGVDLTRPAAPLGAGDGGDRIVGKARRPCRPRGSPSGRGR
jgi:hypothetical protein